MEGDSDDHSGSSFVQSFSGISWPGLSCCCCWTRML